MYYLSYLKHTNKINKTNIIKLNKGKKAHNYIL